MTTAHHRPIVSAPFYADDGDGTMLHRYLDEQFVTRFQQQAASNTLRGSKAQSWRSSDRFGRHAGAAVTLRLPTHRTFYMVSCEVACDALGNPAFDPSRVLSAGFVVRRGSPGNFQTWQLREGKAIGWRKDPHADLEPDHYRRLLQRKLIRPKASDPLYSGEQTHPLRAQLVDIDAGEGKPRKHTLVAGFLPLGGSVDAALGSVTDDPSPGKKTVSSKGQLAEFEYPFGSWDGVSEEVECDCSGRLADVAADLCAHFNWRQSTGLQIKGGMARRAFAPFIRTLLERYHIHNRALSENEALRSLLDQIHFYDELALKPGDGDADLSGKASRGTLLEYIDNHHALLISWAAELSDKGDIELDTGAGKEVFVNPKLPATAYDLYLSQAQAASLRELLLMRAEQAEQMVENSLPVARYAQGPQDNYFIRPFVRYRDHCKNEHIVWGPASKIFRVASPLDPEAARPSLIQLPELGDIRRGFARGLTFVTPKSIADIMEQISPNLDFAPKAKKNRLQACLGFSISFSIPIITICALILLMIILHLLNLFFFWLPYALLKLPRKC